LFELIKRYLFRGCKYKNYKYRKWVADDTPMVEVICEDCNEVIDCGHVYGDTKDWDSKGWIKIRKE